MIIRRAEEKDIDAVLRLLSQVLEIHVRIRPDIFIPGTVKYGAERLRSVFADDKTPVYIAEVNGEVAGYIFCVIKEPSLNGAMKPFYSFFIDDFCVDESFRGQKIGKSLFDFAVCEAKRLGCRDVCLNVWEGNDGARRFYEKMGMRPKETLMEFII